jgi:hypothetical protein
MTTTDGRRTQGSRQVARRVSTQEALRRLGAKRVESPYRAPRGNQELDRGAADRSIEAFQRVLGG